MNKKTVLIYIVGVIFIGFLITTITLAIQFFGVGNQKTEPCSPNITMATYKNEDFNFEIRYPENWYILKLKPEQLYRQGNPETGEQGQEYIFAVSTLKNNFDPDSSKDGEVLSMFITRNQTDNNNPPEQYIETIKQQNQQYNFGFNITNGKVNIAGTEGDFLYMEKGNDNWVYQSIFFNKNGQEYTLNGNILKGEYQKDCQKILDQIQQSFTLLTSNH